MKYPAFETRRWTREEYDRLIDLGILNEDERIELVQGHMVPEPGVSVVRGSPRDVGHPSQAALVAEVSKTSVDRVVEIYREPSEVARTCAYRVVAVARPGEHVAPLAAPRVPIAIDDLLP